MPTPPVPNPGRRRHPARGARIATCTAETELATWGLTLWEFKPLGEENGVIGWKLLQTLARELRDATRWFDITW